MRRASTARPPEAAEEPNVRGLMHAVEEHCPPGEVVLLTPLTPRSLYRVVAAGLLDDLVGAF